jgi:tetratricopeptide (TPR) repeat protein
MAHRLLADAALATAMPHTASLSLEILFLASPGDKALTVELARVLADAGDINRAENLLLELCRQHPGNPELAKELKNISATKTMGENGYEKLGEGGDGNYRDILRDKDEAVSLEQEKRVQKTEDVAARLIRNLAELCTQKNQFDRALAFYQRVKAEEMGNDPSLDRAIALTVVRKYEHEHAQLDSAAPDYAARSAQLQAEKLAFQIAECQQRVEKYPTDLGIRFEMGMLYFAADQINEAISEFQKAQANPHKRIGALNYLAQCFSLRGMNDSAVRMLQNALREKQVFDDEKKELTYQLGCVFEKMGKKPEALEQFTTIYETDIGFKDVSAKVDSFYASQ